MGKLLCRLQLHNHPRYTQKNSGWKVITPNCTRCGLPYNSYRWVFRLFGKRDYNYRTMMQIREWNNG